MKYYALGLVVFIFLAGCSAEAYSDHHESQVLASLQDDVWRNNPDLMIAKCYELSQNGRENCYLIYEQALQRQGKQVDSDVCEKLRIPCE